MAIRDPVVAIVGRPNVGKSTLFNRIAQKRKSIIHSQSGITRDRIYENVNWAGKQFVLIDTGGFVPDSKDTIESAVRAQIGVAVEEADIILFIVDGVEQLIPIDKEVGALLRESAKDVILVANKIDNEKREQNVFEFYSLGFGEPFPISALNGRRIGDLLDIILEHMLKEAPAEKEEEEFLHLAIIGMPNVGKSSIVNAILNVEKSIVTEIPGTTRDSVDSILKYYGESRVDKIDRKFIKLIIILGVIEFASLDIAFLQARSAYYIPPGLIFLIPVFYLLTNIIYMFFSPITGSLSDKIGRKPVIIGGLSILLFSCLFLSIPIESSIFSVTTIIIIYALFGFYLASVDPISRAYIADLAGKNKRGRAYGYYYLSVGLISLGESLIFGLIYDLSFFWAFIYISILLFICIVIFSITDFSKILKN